MQHKKNDTPTPPRCTCTDTTRCDVCREKHARIDRHYGVRGQEKAVAHA